MDRIEWAEMVTEDKGDEEANSNSSGDRVDGDRQDDESEGNSRATRRQRLKTAGGKQGFGRRNGVV
jgi:hypothetical protein